MGSIRVLEVLGNDKKISVTFVLYGDDEDGRFAKLHSALRKAMLKFGNVNVKVGTIPWAKDKS